MGALTQGTAFQGRLAKARQPFAMMLKPVGLQIRCVPKGRPITAEDESSAQTWIGSVNLSTCIFGHGPSPVASSHKDHAAKLPPLRAQMCPKGTPHHSEGLVSFSEPTLVLPANTHRTISPNPDGVPHL